MRFALKCIVCYKCIISWITAEVIISPSGSAGGDSEDARSASKLDPDVNRRLGSILQRTDQQREKKNHSCSMETCNNFSVLMWTQTSVEIFQRCVFLPLNFPWIASRFSSASLRLRLLTEQIVTVCWTTLLLESWKDKVTKCFYDKTLPLLRMLGFLPALSRDSEETCRFCMIRASPSTG